MVHNFTIRFFRDALNLKIRSSWSKLTCRPDTLPDADHSFDSKRALTYWDRKVLMSFEPLNSDMCKASFPLLLPMLSLLGFLKGFLLEFLWILDVSLRFFHSSFEQFAWKWASCGCFSSEASMCWHPCCPCAFPDETTVAWRELAELAAGWRFSLWKRGWWNPDGSQTLAA